MASFGASKCGRKPGGFTRITLEVLVWVKTVTENLESFILELIENIISNMNVKDKSFQKVHAELQDEYFPKFKKANSELRQVRQRLRQLAERTITETRDLKILLKGLDETDDTFLLEAAIEKMKDLMVLSTDPLIEAKEKYNNAIETFTNLYYSIKTQNMFLKKILDNTKSEDYKALEENIGLLEILWKEGTALLFEEIVVLNIWEFKVDTVSINIDRYPQDYLKKYKAIRTVFINGLIDLQTTPTEFLNRGELFENDAKKINNPEDQE